MTEKLRKSFWDGKADPRFKELAPAEEGRLIDKWRFDGDLKAREKLAKAYMPLAHCAARYASTLHNLQRTDKESVANAKLARLIQVIATPGNLDDQGSVTRVHNFIFTSIFNAVKDEGRITRTWCRKNDLGQPLAVEYAAAPANHTMEARRLIVALAEEAGLNAEERQMVDIKMEGLCRTEIGKGKSTSKRIYDRAIAKMKVAAGV